MYVIVEQLFNLRDLSSIYSGMTFVRSRDVKTPRELTRLLVHESSRVYGDKLVDNKDKETFERIQREGTFILCVRVRMAMGRLLPMLCLYHSDWATH